MLADEEDIDVGEVLSEIFGIEGTVIHDELNTTCPHPRHDDAHPSCNINLVTGLWRCLSCGARGDLVSLGHHALRLPRSRVRRLLLPQNTGSQLARARSRLRRLQSTPRASRTASEGDDRSWLPEDAREPHSYRSGPLDYLYGRNLTPETVQAWGCRYVRRARVPGKAGLIEINNSVAIPIHTPDGRLHSWCYRATNLSPSWQPRYLYSYGAVHRPLLGCYLPARYTEVDTPTRRLGVLTEGAIDAMTVYQAGFHALGLGGNTRSDLHGALNIVFDFRKIVLFFDNDAGGSMATTNIGKLLWGRVPLYVARYPAHSDGADPNKLSCAQIVEAVANAVAWSTWMLLKGLRPARSA